MDRFKQAIKHPIAYLKALIKWIFISALGGCLGGVLGSVFHIMIDLVTEFREENGYVIYFIPLAAVIICVMYGFFKNRGSLGTDRILDCLNEDEPIPAVMIPLIFVSSTVSHLAGASVGREGAALQLGGGLFHIIGRVFRLNPKDMKIAVMSGMSAVFAALFGTPLAASVFALEIAGVGAMHYGAIVPCVLSAVVAFRISGIFGISPVRFIKASSPALTPSFFAEIIIFSVICAAVSIVFCVTVKAVSKKATSLMPNPYVKALVCSGILLALSVIFGSGDYNGAGMHIIAKALDGVSKPEAFIVKIIFTAVSIAAGFKGGEIVPAFFVGSAFGAVVSPFLGIESSLGAAMGFIALFCGVVNCPLASLFLAIEVFGGDLAVIFAIVCSVSYMMYGRFSLYGSQEFVYSKTEYDNI